MEIRTYFHATETEVVAKKFNIYIGISLGNHFFSKKRLQAYILWALEHTRESVLIVIADSNHAVNIEVMKGCSPEAALARALQQGMQCEEMVRSIVSGLPTVTQGKIQIIHWDEVRKSVYHQKHILEILNAFQTDPNFHNAIIRIVQENLGEKVALFGQVELEKLARYVLDELPVLVNGIEYHGVVYGLLLYPGLSSLDDLIVGLHDKTVFHSLAGSLNATNEIAVVEAYVEDKKGNEPKGKPEKLV